MEQEKSKSDYDRIEIIILLYSSSEIGSSKSDYDRIEIS